MSKTLSLFAPYSVLDRFPGEVADDDKFEYALALAMCGRFPELFSLETPIKRFLRGDGDPPSIESDWFLAAAVVSLLAFGPTTETIGPIRSYAAQEDADIELRIVARIVAAAALAVSATPDDALREVESASPSATGVGTILSVAMKAQYALRLAEGSRFERSTKVVNECLEEIRNAFPNLQATSNPSVEERVFGAFQLSLESNARSLERVQSDNVRFEPRINELDYRLGREAWRSLDRRTSSTLQGLTEEIFRKQITGSIQSSSQFFSATDQVDRGSAEAWLTSNLYADWARSRLTARQWGLLRLVRSESDDSDGVRLGVQMLSASGSAKDLKNAVKAVRSRGPVEVIAGEVRRAATSTLADLTDRNLSPSRANLTLLEQGAEFLTTSEIDALTVELLKTSDIYAKRDWLGFFRYDYMLWDTLEEFAPYLEQSREILIDAILDRIANTDGVTSRNLARILDHLNAAGDDGPAARRLLDWSLSNLNDTNQTLAENLAYQFAAHGNAYAVDALVDRWRASRSLNTGADLANLAWRDSDLVPADIAGQVIESATSILQRTRDEAASGSYGYGGVDAGIVASLLSAKYPSFAEWDSIVSFLLDPKVAIAQKELTLDWLSRNSGHLPRKLAERISDDLPKVLAGPHDDFAVGGAEGPGLRFACAARAITPDRAIGLFLKLAGSEDAGRRLQGARSGPLVAQVASPDMIGGVMLQLLRDDVVVVRAATSRRLARMAILASDAVRSALVSALVDCLSTDGVTLRLSAMQGVLENLDEAPDELIEATHPIIESLAQPGASLQVENVAKLVVNASRLRNLT